MKEAYPLCHKYILLPLYAYFMADPESLTTFVLVDGGREVLIPLKVWHHLPASELSFKLGFPCRPIPAQH